MELQNADNKTASASGENTWMTPSELKKLNADDFIMLPIARENYRERKTHMSETKNTETPADVSGQLTILKNNLSPNKNVTVIDPPQSPLEPQENSSMVGSQSMRLINDSAKHLFDRMEKTGSVVEAAMCASQIAKLIRLKLEIKRYER